MHQFITLGVFQKLIERAGNISGEFKRKKLDAIEEEPKSEQKNEKKRKNKAETAPVGTQASRRPKTLLLITGPHDEHRQLGRRSRTKYQGASH